MKRFPLITVLFLLTLVGPTTMVRAEDGQDLRERQAAAEAEQVWQGILQQDQTNAVAYYNLGIALANQAKWSEAIAAYRSALDHDPNLTVAYINLGQALTMTHQHEAAAQTYQTLLQLEPQHSLAQERLRQLSPSGGLAVQPF